MSAGIMSTIQLLRAVVNERLSAAAEEILEAVKKTIDGYEEEIGRQRQLLQAVLQPQIKLEKPAGVSFTGMHRCSRQHDSCNDACSSSRCRSEQRQNRKESDVGSEAKLASRWFCLTPELPLSPHVVHTGVQWSSCVGGFGGWGGGGRGRG